MRAVLIKNEKGPVSALYIGEVEKPSPKPGQVIVKVKAFGVNHADLHQRDGDYPPPPGASTILGLEFSGIVDTVGSDVTTLKIGDEVLGLTGGGAYAEYAPAYALNCIKKPKDVSWERGAAIMETWLTAFQAMIRVGDFKKGENFLVHGGTSGIAISCMQLAHLYQGDKIFTTVSSPAKAQAVADMHNGSTDIINYKTHDFAEEIKKSTSDQSAPGVDLIVDFIGQDYFTRNLTSLRRDGRMVILGALSGFALPEGVSLTPILMKRLSIFGTTLRSRSPEYQAEVVKKFEKDVFPYFFEPCKKDNDKPVLDILIHKVYSWKDIQEAHLEMEHSKSMGKIVVLVD